MSCRSFSADKTQKNDFYFGNPSKQSVSVQIKTIYGSTKVTDVDQLKRPDNLGFHLITLSSLPAQPQVSSRVANKLSLVSFLRSFHYRSLNTVALSKIRPSVHSRVSFSSKSARQRARFLLLVKIIIEML